MKRLIFHIDVNSAFLSWESTRRVKNGEADLRLIPSVIGGSPECAGKINPRETIQYQNRRAYRNGAAQVSFPFDRAA